MREFIACKIASVATFVCATKDGAVIVGCGVQFGTLEAGKLGDVLVVEGDVHKDISLFEDRHNILAVQQGGRLRSAASLPIE